MSQSESALDVCPSFQLGMKCDNESGQEEGALSTDSSIPSVDGDPLTIKRTKKKRFNFPNFVRRSTRKWCANLYKSSFWFFLHFSPLTIVVLYLLRQIHGSCPWLSLAICFISRSSVATEGFFKNKFYCFSLLIYLFLLLLGLPILPPWTSKSTADAPISDLRDVWVYDWCSPIFNTLKMFLLRLALGDHLCMSLWTLWLILFFLNSVHELHCALRPLPQVVKRNGKFSEIYRDELQ